MLNDLKSHLGSSLHSVRRFLERPITLGGDGNVGLGIPESSVREQARDERRQRVRAMKRDLYTLLEQHATSRTVMRHLDLVERTLRRDGLQALEALPIRVIGKALAEMERLVWDWSPAGLAELRSRMAVMVKTRRAEAAGTPPTTETLVAELADDLDAAGHSDDAQHSAYEVTEVDHSAYEETERSWAGQMPEGLAAAQAAAQAGAMKAAA
jgi:hypothetical protein